MNAPTLSRAEFEQLLAEHRQLIHLANELEYHLYQVGAQPPSERVSACQQAAGALIGQLRTALFRHDQLVFPALESLLPSDAAHR